MRRLLFIVALLVQLPRYLPEWSYLLARLAWIVVAGELRALGHLVARFALGSLAKFLGDVAAILRWVNHRLGLK